MDVTTRRNFPLYLLVKRQISLPILLLPLLLSAQPAFLEKSLELGLQHTYLNGKPMGGGAAWFDYDNDGDEDIWITGGSNQDQLFRNEGGASFSNVSLAAGLGITDGIVTNGVLTGDLDNDGDRDVLVTTDVLWGNLLFRNNGDGSFTDISLSSGIGSDTAWSTVASFGDVNLDGFLDLYIGNYVERVAYLLDPATGAINGFDHQCYEDFYYLNEGMGDGTISFARLDMPAMTADTGCALAVAFTDYDQDRDMDLFLVNDFGEWIEHNRIFRNRYPGNFFKERSVDVGLDARIYGMGIAIGDYDQDEDIDYYLTNIGRNVLHQNQGNGIFQDATTSAGVEDLYEDSLYTVGWGTGFVDVDNDTDLDLWVTNGYVPAASFIEANPSNPDRLFLNQGDGSFVDSAAVLGVDSPAQGRGSAFADIDQDGDQDLLVVPVNVPGTGTPVSQVLLYQNSSNSSHHWLKVRLRGTLNNRDGFGSHIRIVLPDHSWVHEVSGGSSHGSQNSSIAHFGLGGATMVDSLIISWPGGVEQVLTNILADQQITVVEDSALYPTGSEDLPDPALSLSVYPNPFSDQISVSYLLSRQARVRLTVFDLQGKQVALLVDEFRQPGDLSAELEEPACFRYVSASSAS